LQQAHQSMRNRAQTNQANSHCLQLTVIDTLREYLRQR
jgi:hypothetical protein